MQSESRKPEVRPTLDADGEVGEPGRGGGTPAPAPDAARHDYAAPPGLSGRGGKARALKKLEEASSERNYAPRERLHLLDMWQRSGLAAGDFEAIVGVSKHTLYAWKKRFEAEGPAGLEDHPRPQRGSKLDDTTRRAIVMLKEAHPEYGCERIAALLLRSSALQASPGAVARLLKEEGYEAAAPAPERHEPPVRRFERARPNQLWQTDLFTFLLKRSGQRVYMVGFLDDCSRFIVSYGLQTSQSTALTIEALRAGIGAFGPPEEVLTDNGAQYVTWRGKGAFTRELEKRGIRQIVSRPRHPETLGKVERFWGTLWRECLETAIFRDLGEARLRIGQFIDHYNFQRPHQALDGLVPADRFFGAESEIRRALEARVAANALEIARDGPKPAPFYLAGQMHGKGFSVHAEGESLILTREEGEREEISLTSPDAGEEAPAPVIPPPVAADGSPPLDREAPEEAEPSEEVPS